MTKEMEMQSQDEASSIPDLFRYRPSIPDVLAVMFEDYRFSLGGCRISTYEVFLGNSFLPILAHITCNRMRNLFGMEVEVNSMDDEVALLGVSVEVEFESPSDTLFFLLSSVMVAKDIFGESPGDINLDALHHWAQDENAQREGLPYLGVSH